MKRMIKAAEITPVGNTSPYPFIGMTAYESIHYVCSYISRWNVDVSNQYGVRIVGYGEGGYFISISQLNVENDKITIEIEINDTDEPYSGRWYTPHIDYLASCIPEEILGEFQRDVARMKKDV